MKITSIETIPIRVPIHQNLAIRAKAHAAPGEARRVWKNPILWREIRTYAYGRRPLLVKISYAIVLALICWFALGELNRGGGRQSFARMHDRNLPAGAARCGEI